MGAVNRTKTNTSGNKKGAKKETPINNTGGSMHQWKYQSHSWEKNSCWVDAPLDIWDTLQLWASSTMDRLALLPPHTVERNAHVGEYTPNLIASEAEDVLPLTPEYGDPLKRWWKERYTLYTGNLTAEGAKKAKKRLVLARNALRRACVEKEVIANDETQLKERIEQGMEDFGSGIATLMKLLQDSSPEEFLRTRYICECPSCNKQQHSLQVSSWSMLSSAIRRRYNMWILIHLQRSH